MTKRTKKTKPARRRRATRPAAPPATVTPPPPAKLMLDLGAGPESPPGFLPLGNAHGSAIFPLPFADSSADVIRASHVLEHFPYGQAIEVIQHWVSKLKPGGELRIAVPDLAVAATDYLAGKDTHTQGYIMGGQTRPDDFHKAIFDEELLAECMRQAGLIGLYRWKSELPGDCAALPVSLNLAGVKPRKLPREGGTGLKVAAVMSVPRLGFMDNFFCAFEALQPMGISLTRYTGAYWDACLHRAIEKCIEQEAPDIVLTLDYDTVFKRADVEKQLQIMEERPEVDALAAIQTARSQPRPLLTMDLPVGVKSHDRIPFGVFKDDILPCRTAHFGLTMIRTSALAKLPKPWFKGEPDPEGGWGEGRIDPDIFFWRQFEAAGLKLFSANRVVVGHMELMVLWPGEDFRVVTQLPKDFQAGGKPAEAFK